MSNQNDPQRTYIRPLGYLFGNAAREACAKGLAAPIAGGETSFSIGEIAKRGANNAAERALFSVRDLLESTPEVKSALERISASRADFAEIPMNRPTIMGIVNVTPDSFSDGGKFFDPANAIKHALELAEAGADVLDIGGESTRPGADLVDVESEISRVIPVIEGLRGKTRAKISIDTRKAEVMRRAAEAGADIINDVSALSFDPDSLEVAAKTGLPVILMHAQGTPQTMQDNPTYDDVLLDVFDYLQTRIELAENAGIPRSKIMADTGIGFGKNLDHNLTLLAGQSFFHGLGVPLLLGVSRKRVLGQLADNPDPDARMPGSVAAALSGVAQGVQMVRVHDVAETYQAVNAWRATISGEEPSRHDI